MSRYIEELELRRILDGARDHHKYVPGTDSATRQDGWNDAIFNITNAMARADWWKPQCPDCGDFMEADDLRCPVCWAVAAVRASEEAVLFDRAIHKRKEGA